MLKPAVFRRAGHHLIVIVDADVQDAHLLLLSLFPQGIPFRHIDKVHENIFIILRVVIRPKDKGLRISFDFNLFSFFISSSGYERFSLNTGQGKEILFRNAFVSKYILHQCVCRFDTSIRCQYAGGERDVR